MNRVVYLDSILSCNEWRDFLVDGGRPVFKKIGTLIWMGVVHLDLDVLITVLVVRHDGWWE